MVVSILAPFAAQAATSAEVLAQIAALTAQAEALRAKIQEKLGNPIYTPASYTSPLSKVPAEIRAITCPSFTNSFGRGSTGAGITVLQQFLVAAGFLDQSSVSGRFGTTTEVAIKEFQTHEGIISYGTPESTGWGYVGARTRARITERCSQALTMLRNSYLSETTKGFPKIFFSTTTAASIDTASLVSTSSFPAITGLATPLGKGLDMRIGDVFGTSTLRILVVDGRWSVTFVPFGSQCPSSNPRCGWFPITGFATGTYPVWIYANTGSTTPGILLASSTLRIL